MLNFGPTFRALTSGSPITTALNEARQMARRHLETGGVVMPVDGDGYVTDFRIWNIR